MQQLETNDRGGFYKAEWAVDSPLVICIAQAGGVIMEAQGSIDAWTLHLWFEEPAQASAFRDCCEANSVPMTVKRISSLSGAFSNGPARISEEQRETLLLAHQRGYYEEPRRVTQEALATELDISASAVGSRLRRGHRNLIEETLHK